MQRPLIRLSLLALSLGAGAALAEVAHPTGGRSTGTPLPGSPRGAALNVAVFSSSYGAEVVTPTGHTGTAVTLAEVEGGILAGFDVLALGHAGYNSDWSAQACTEIEAFVANGGAVVTEWNGVTALFETVDPGTYYPVPIPCGLFPGGTSQGNIVATGTPIDVTDAASPLVAGLTDPFAMGPGSEYFFAVSGQSPAVWTVAATYDGWGGTYPAVMTAPYGAGCVVVGTMDYWDAIPGDANAVLLFTDLLDFAGSAACRSFVAQTLVDVPTLGGAGLAALAGALALAAFVALRRRPARR